MTWLTVTEYMSQMTTDMLFVIITIHRRITKGATGGSGTIYTFPEHLRLFRIQQGCIAQSLVCLCSVLQIIVCPFPCWSLYCLSFDLRLIPLFFLNITKSEASLLCDGIQDGELERNERGTNSRTITNAIMLNISSNGLVVTKQYNFYFIRK